MKCVIFFLISLFAHLSFAKDCGSVKPFKSNGTLSAHITVGRFYWKDGKQIDEDVCSGELKIPSYDVRGREDDAFYCLQPNPAELLVCKTKIYQDDAELTVVPAAWVRKWNPKDAREYRFHAYVVKTKDSNFYYDVFSRSLSDSLKLQNLTVEGALKTGPGNPTDGYFIRTKFLK